MNQLEYLLTYQDTDLQVDKYEMEIKQSPLRQKLVKLRNFLANAQKKLDKMETDVANLLSRMDEIMSDMAQVREREKALTKAAASIDQNDMNSIRDLIQKTERLSEDINYYERHLKKVQNEAADVGGRQHELVAKAHKAKDDFTKMKSIYDDEYKEAGEKLEALKKKRNEAARPIDAALLERYRHVKSHRVPPMALLSNDQCMGCNMSLPSVVMRSAQQGKIIECENCGRILYTAE